jgi:predicted nucleotide-binding protein
MLEQRDRRFLDKAIAAFNSVQQAIVCELAAAPLRDIDAGWLSWPPSPELSGNAGSSQHTVCVSSLPFEDNWFSHTEGTLSIISTSGWETQFSPPHVDCYLLAELALGAFIQSCNIDENALRPHEDDTGCFFDLCANKASMRWKMKCGYLCGAHQELYRQFGGQDECLEAIVKILDAVRSVALGRSCLATAARPAGKPRVFIGSSSEGQRVASKLNDLLDGDAECTIWADGVFGLGQCTLEALVDATRDYDFAVLVLTPDDVTTRRARTGNAPRDNVLFELGLFMGALGRRRTFVVRPRDVEIEMPSDLAGITAATFQWNREDRNLGAALRPAATRIAESIAAELAPSRPEPRR